MIIDPSIFRDYDVRAVAGQQLDVDGVKRIAKAIVKIFNPKTMQVGHDMRVTSNEYYEAFIDSVLECGVDVVKLGLVSTDMLYYASGTYDEDMSVTISASHNPPEYNGMKMVKKGAIAISGDSGIYDIRDLSISDKPIDFPGVTRGKVAEREIMTGFVEHDLKFIDVSLMKKFKVVIDTGNGMAGYFMPEIEKSLPWEVTHLYYELDGTFPHHVPSPIEEKNRLDCINKVKELKADFGLVFDGDGDRVFLIDEKGRTLSGTIVTAAIAENILKKNQNATILYNAIVGRVVKEIVQKFGGKSERVRVGHTLIKEAMRKFDGTFCGEHSGHYYFKENFYADSAIIAALLVAESMSVSGRKLSDIYDEYNKYPASQEINFEVTDKMEIMKAIEIEFKDSAKSIDWLDGITVWFDTFWFNVRPSNTEPLLRLNVEADNFQLLEEKIKELVLKIESFGAKEKV